jgi:cell wall-associated NlpC family hydrolase
MTTRLPHRTGAVAAALLSVVTGCTTPATLGVSPTDILSAVIAGIDPSTTTSSSSRRPSSTRSRRIPASPAPSAAAARLLRTADSYVGVPYVWGGNTPKGFDCSGFTKYIFAKYDIALPRTSREQSRVGAPVSAAFGSLRPGDLMFFAEPDEAISHVAIYAGDGVIIHSSSSVGGVGYTNLNDGGDWFVANFVAARRVQ